MIIPPYLIAAAQASHKTFWPRGPFVSVSIAQFGLESDWGKAQSGVNNFFGIKANAEQIATGEFTTRWTKEQDATGMVRTIQDLFANYASLEACFDAHATLLTSAHYHDCEAAQTPEAYCYALKADEYATAINYPEALIAIINDFKLKQYDQTF